MKRDNYKLQWPKKFSLHFLFFILSFAFYIDFAFAADIIGRVEIEGRYSIIPRKGLEERIKAERNLVVSKEGGIKDAVIFIRGIKGGHSSQQRETIIIDQKNKTFIPHVLVIPPGTTVRFKSSDPFVHRIISDSDAKKIRLELAYEGAEVDITFDKTGIVEIRCDDHKRMQAWILVTDTQFFTNTDGKGNFIIANVPHGKYTLEVWHEVLGTQTREIEIKGGENVIKVNFKLQGKEF